MSAEFVKRGELFFPTHICRKLHGEPFSVKVKRPAEDMYFHFRRGVFLVPDRGGDSDIHNARKTFRSGFIARPDRVDSERGENPGVQMQIRGCRAELFSGES